MIPLHNLSIDELLNFANTQEMNPLEAAMFHHIQTTLVNLETECREKDEKISDLENDNDYLHDDITTLEKEVNLLSNKVDLLKNNGLLKQLRSLTESMENIVRKMEIL